MSIITEELAWILGLPSQDDFLLSGSVLLTPPDSVLPDDGPYSPSDSENILSSLHYFCDDISIKTEPESEEDLCNIIQTYNSAANVELRSLIDFKESIPTVVASYEENVADLIVEITNSELEIIEHLEKLKKQLAHLLHLERSLVLAESTRIENKIVLSRNEGLAVQTLIHAGRSQPILYDIPMPVKFPHCRIGHRLELTEKEQFQFKSAILTSVVEQKLLRTAGRFDGLLLSAGVTEIQLDRLRELNYDHYHISGLIVQNNLSKNRFQTVAPVVQTWYSSERKLEAVARSVMTVSDLHRWKQDLDKKAKQTTLKDVFGDTQTRIDWMHVSAIMALKVGVKMEPQECEFLWNSVLNPSCDGFPWTQRSLLSLQKAVSLIGKQDWTQIAKYMGQGISQFMCFVMYTNFVQSYVNNSSECNYNWSLQEKQVVNNEISQGGNYLTATSALNKYFPAHDYITFAGKLCYASTLKFVKSSFDPVTAMEDAVLLVTLEKISGLVTRPQINLHDLLPFGKFLIWRSNEKWSHRLKLLFDECKQPWTVQEELKLLYLARELQGRWHLIVREYDGIFEKYRTRTAIRNHYVKLMSVLANSTYLQYRKEYEDQWRNSLLYVRLRNACDELRRLSEEMHCEENIREFRGLSKDYPPNDTDLGECLLSQSPHWIFLTLQRINRFLYNSTGDISSTMKARSHDRRTFHREDPMSVASALHIRRLRAKPLAEIDSISKFEKLVVFHLDNFYKRRQTKRNGIRTYIPSTHELRRLPELSRILKRPIRETVDILNNCIPSQVVKIDDNFVILRNNVINLSEDIKLESVEEATPVNMSHVPDASIAIANAIDFGMKLNKNKGADVVIDFNIPKLRDKKGKKMSRLSEIRRLTAKRRWLNRQPQVLSVDDTMQSKEEITPFLDKLPFDPNIKLECPVPNPPSSPLKEIKKNIFSPPHSPQKRPKRDKKAPNRFMYN